LAGKRKFKLRFYMLLLVPVLIIGAYLGYKILNPSTGRLSSDTVEADVAFTGVVIRKETVVEAPEYSSLRYLVGEGEYVENQQPVALLYGKDYTSQLSEILSQSQKIYRQQITLLKLASSDTVTLPQEVSAYNAQIEQTMEKMTQAAMGDSQYNYMTLADELQAMLTARETYMREITPADAALTANYEILDRLKSSFSAQSTLLNNGGSGYISFHLDGYETAMNILSLSASQVRKTASSPLSSTTGNGLFRIVEPGGFYIAFTVRGDEAHRFVVGEKYDMQVSHQDKVFSGRVVAEKPSESYVLYILEVEEDSLQVLENRTMDLSIHYTGSGTAVPVDGIYFNGGVPYLYVYTGNGYSPIKIEILCADDKTAVIRAADRQIQLKSGIRFLYYEEPSADEAGPTATPIPTATPSPAPTQTGTIEPPNLGSPAPVDPNQFPTDPGAQASPGSSGQEAP
jgi:hypothetical protein